MRGSQKQRQQLTLRQKSYLATRGLVLEQPLSDFETLMDRFAAGSIVAEKHARADTSGDMWNGDLDSFADATECTPAELIVDELLDRDLIDDSQVECARFVASDLDERGFFTKQISRYAVSIGVPTVDVRRILSAIRTLEPAGLGATDIAHAFALEMLRVLPDLPVAACARFLRTRQRSVSPGVIRACLRKLAIQCDPATLQHILSVLDPEPARRMISGPIHIVVPDIIIEQDSLTGTLQCSIPGPAWGLAIDPMVVSSARKDPEAKKQVHRSYQSPVDRRCHRGTHGDPCQAGRRSHGFARSVPHQPVESPLARAGGTLDAGDRYVENRYGPRTPSQICEDPTRHLQTSFHGHGPVADCSSSSQRDCGAAAPIRQRLKTDERPGNSGAPCKPGPPHQSTNGRQVSSVTWNPGSILQRQLIIFCFLLAAFAYHVDTLLFRFNRCGPFLTEVDYGKDCNQRTWQSRSPGIEAAYHTLSRGRRCCRE